MAAAIWMLVSLLLWVATMMMGLAFYIKARNYYAGRQELFQGLGYGRRRIALRKRVLLKGTAGTVVRLIVVVALVMSVLSRGEVSKQQSAIWLTVGFAILAGLELLLVVWPLARLQREMKVSRREMVQN